MSARNLLTSLLVASSVVQGAPALQREGDVTVLAHGPAGLRIEGKCKDVSLEDQPSVLLFKVALAPIDTGIGLRNRHLRESLEVDKFPDATLRVMRADLKFPKEGSRVESQVTGELTLHGRSRSVPVHYRAERRHGGPTQIVGSLQLDMRDFQIVPPSYLGVAVSPDVEVDINLTVDGL
jgi:polyisoprenoid-binding protein YceI